MKRNINWLPALLFIGGLAWAFGVSGDLQGQTLDEIMAKNYRAHGGLEKLKAVTAMKISGKMAIPDQGLEMPVVIWQKYPDKMRVESSFQNKKVVQAYDGKKAWWIMPFQSDEPQEMTPEQAAQFAEQADFENPLVVFREKGYKLELLGEEDLAGTAVYKLKLTKSGGREIFYYLDADSGLEVKSTLTLKTGESETLHEILYGEYKPVDGMVMPFTVENRTDGRTQMQMKMEKLEINPVMADSLFAMPQKKEAAETGGQKQKPAVK
jgi:outer membrane lipoprotein-sorting protein